MSAALLELIVTLLDVFDDDPRLDLVILYKPLLQEALKDATIAERRTRLRLLLPPSVTRGVETDSWIDSRAPVLSGLISSLTAREQIGQRRFGFEAIAGGAKSAVFGVGESTRTGLKDRFKIDGVTWEILAVHESFVYHPRYGTEPSLLLFDGKPDEKRAGARLMTVRRTEKGGPVTHDVLGTEDVWLAQLAHAVTMIGIVRQLESLGELIKDFAELTLDVLELVQGSRPGAHGGPLRRGDHRLRHERGVRRAPRHVPQRSREGVRVGLRPREGALHARSAVGMGALRRRVGRALQGPAREACSKASCEGSLVGVRQARQSGQAHRRRRRDGLSRSASSQDAGAMGHGVAVAGRPQPPDSEQGAAGGRGQHRLHRGRGAPRLRARRALGASDRRLRRECRRDGERDRGSSSCPTTSSRWARWST